MSHAERRTKEVKQFIDTHIEVSGPHEIADQLGFSYETLRKDFRRVTGVTLGLFLMQEKVRYAKHLLRTTDLRCFKISGLVGYPRGGCVPNLLYILFHKQKRSSPSVRFGIAKQTNLTTNDDLWRKLR